MAPRRPKATSATTTKKSIRIKKPSIKAAILALALLKVLKTTLKKKIITTTLV